MIYIIINEYNYPTESGYDIVGVCKNKSKAQELLHSESDIAKENWKHSIKYDYEETNSDDYFEIIDKFGIHFERLFIEPTSIIDEI